MILQALIGVKLGWFHGRRQRAGRAPASLTQLSYLTLPALALVIVYFGYIARMTRAGVIRALDADYTRTATMKGLANRQVLRRHVLRNGLQPTVSVVGVQIGYVLGSLVAIEKVFNYPGLGSDDRQRRRRRTCPCWSAGVLLVAIVYMLATLAADLILAWMNPRARLEVSVVTAAEPLDHRRCRRGRPRRRCAPSGARPGASAGGCCGAGRRSSSARSSCCSGSSARSAASTITPHGPMADELASGAVSPRGSHLFGTDQLGRDVLSRVMVGARDVLIVAPAGGAHQRRRRHVARAARGLPPGRRSTRSISRVMEAILAIPVILIGLVVLTNFGSSRCRS